MKIAVIGAGAMGSLYGGYLSKAGQDVCLIDVWQEHVDRINREGLAIEEASGDIKVYPKAVCHAREVGTADLAIVFVKSIMTQKAMEANLDLIGPETAVLSLQNGYGNVEEIARFVERERIIAGTTAHGATMLQPGRIRHAGIGATHIGAVSGEGGTDVAAVAQVLRHAGFETEVSGNVMKLVWDKLMINVGINALTAILKVPNGRLLEHEEARMLMEAAVEEAVRVANAAGMDLDREETIRRVMSVAGRTGENRSSMLQDITNGRRTEIDTINGAIIREGKKHGIHTPVNMVLTNLIRIMEKSQ